MDKLLYVAMSGAKETLASQAVNNDNLANASTTGFKASMAAFQTRSVSGAGFASRAYATAGTVGWNHTDGEQSTTGNSLDVAVQGAGFFAVQDLGGAVKGFKDGMKGGESAADTPQPPASGAQIAGQTIEGEVKKEKTL